MGTSDRLPPFSALRGFEAAVRHKSFRRAAEEHCLTQSAISHQVKLLEDFFGKPLFDRTPTGVTLTGAGQRYFQDIEPIFERLKEVSRKLMEGSDRSALTIRCSPGFATRWLMPRLANAQLCLPDLEMNLTTAPASRDDVDTADVRINCGYEVPPGPNSTIFMTTRRAPVCSPDFLARHGPIRSIGDLLHVPLLRELEGDEWDDWFSLHTLGQAPSGNMVYLDDGYSTLAAAEGGLGVALGHLTFIQPEIEQGRMLQLFAEETNISIIFTLTSPLGWQAIEKIVRFRDWLFLQIEAGRNVPAPGKTNVGKRIRMVPDVSGVV